MENKEYRKLMDDYHVIVCNKEREMIHKYKNLGGLHKFVSRRWKEALTTINSVEPVGVWLYQDYKRPDTKPFHRTHKLLIQFENLDYAYMFFASYDIMKEHVKRWRNLKGLPLIEYRTKKIIPAHREESIV